MNLKSKHFLSIFRFGTAILTLLGMLFISTRCSHIDSNQSQYEFNRRPASDLIRVAEVPEGLSGNDSANFYHLSEGSDVYPYEWFEALQSIKHQEKLEWMKDPVKSAKKLIGIYDPQRPRFHKDLDKRFGMLIDTSNQTLKSKNGKKEKTFLMSEIGLSVTWSDHHPTTSDAFYEDEATEAYTNKKYNGVENFQHLNKSYYNESNSLPSLYREIDSPKHKLKSIRMVGINCAICHTSELITKSNEKIRLDGGSNLFNVRGFFEDMSKSTIAMLYKQEWLEKFLEKLKVPDAKAKAELVHKYFMAEVGKATREQHFKEALRNSVNNWENEKSKKIGIQLLQFLDNHDNGVSDAAEKIRNAILNKFISLDNSTTITFLLAKMGRRERLYDAQNAISNSLEKLLRVTYGFSDNDNIGVLKARMHYLGNLLVGTNPTLHEIPAGYARTDAFGRIANLVLREENPINLTGQVSFPWIWGIKYMAMLHYNANTNSVILRNTGQAQGVGALIIDNDFNSTVNIYNLNRLEHLVHKIKYPQWTKLFTNVQALKTDFYVDQEKAARGKYIYEQKCQTCHESNKFVGPNDNPKDNKLRYFKEFPLDLIGTDKTVAINATEPVPSTPSGNMVPFEKAILQSVQSIKQKYYDTYSVKDDYGYVVTKKDQEDMEFRELRGPEFFRDTVNGFKKEKLKEFGIELKYGDTNEGQGYKARHLSSVWATGPFLHNGSVPTIWDLLQPSEKRPKYFNVKSREFDPIKLGYKNDRNPNLECENDEIECFDTTPKGTITTNMNTGHEGILIRINNNGEEIKFDFGTNMEEKDKWALIEYLKVLPPDPEYDWKDRSIEDAIKSKIE